PILLVGVGLFLAGSLLCGLSRSPTALILSRAVQGVGSASLFTSAFAVVADIFPPAVRGRYTGIFGGVWGLASVVGPFVGGLVTFVVVERHAADPLLDLRLFGNPVFARGNAAVFTVGATFLAAIVFLPLFMVNVVGLSATASGLTMTPLTLGLVAGNVLSGQI